jgi:ABC-type lipoprotein export system ATPase subunit
MTIANVDLKIRDLVIEYSSGGYPVRPIDGLSLDASGGQLVLLLGASGCGKTTLLSVLAAILTPTSGSAEVGGVEVTMLRGAALTQYRRRTVGVVFQAFNLVPSLTAVENVLVPLRAAKVRRNSARQRAVALLQQVDLGHRLDHRPADMSGALSVWTWAVPVTGSPGSSFRGSRTGRVAGGTPLLRVVRLVRRRAGSLARWSRSWRRRRS